MDEAVCKIAKIWDCRQKVSQVAVGENIATVILDLYGGDDEIPQPFDSILTAALHVADGVEAHRNREEYESYWQELDEEIAALK